jgi:hypothetical protein
MLEMEGEALVIQFDRMLVIGFFDKAVFDAWCGADGQQAR